MRLMLASLTVALLAGCASTGEKKETTSTPPKSDAATAAATSTPLTAEESVLVTARGTVQAIDLNKRELTLKSSLGKVETVKVDKRVQRLDEVRVGDEVTADYFVCVAGELRPPTEAEKAAPISTYQGVARAPKGYEPAGVDLLSVKIVTTVEGLDLSERTVTLRGPQGNDVTIRAKSVDNLKKLRLGDTIVVTYTEALCVALNKAPRN